MAIVIARGLLVLSLGFMEHCRFELENCEDVCQHRLAGQSEQSGFAHNCPDILSRAYFAVTQRSKLLPVLTVCFRFI